MTTEALLTGVAAWAFDLPVCSLAHRPSFTRDNILHGEFSISFADQCSHSGSELLKIELLRALLLRFPRSGSPRQPRLPDALQLDVLMPHV